MRAMTPWTGMSNLRRDLERLFDRFEDFKMEELPALGDWIPSLDVSETKDALVVKAEAPGLDPKDIEISLQEHLLTIKGEKKQEKEETDQQYHRVERSYGVFSRSVRLPVGLMEAR